MPSKKFCILVAEDDATLSLVVKKELIDAGYDVLVAFDGEKAIALAQSNNIDMALLDINMPKLNGFDVLRFIKKTFPYVKVIMLTGHADLKNTVEAKLLGADDFIGKPYEVEDLLATIDRVLSS